MRSWRPCSGPATAVSAVLGGVSAPFLRGFFQVFFVVPLLLLSLQERVDGKIKPAQQSLRQRAALRLLLGYLAPGSGWVLNRFSRGCVLFGNFVNGLSL